MEEVLISGLIIAAIVAIVLFFVMRGPQLSEQEKDFVAFVQKEAKNRKLVKSQLYGFLFEEWDKLVLVYGKRIDFFTLDNAPLVKKTIEDTYQSAG